MKKSTKWNFFGFLANILLTSAHKLSGPYFECGPHGRFEYCIDNIPGCVIGCHCHPGYYFDTESKVCESNGKLQQRQEERQYRRQYVEEVIPTPKVTTTTELSPTPTTTSIIDKNVDAIAKDADDLGDWLYNQFFKTLENQVMNKTEESPTRRSGTKSGENTGSTSKPLERNKLNIQTRRSGRRRHGKRMVKKKRSKKALRRKLLRISEDDSLFDSSSGSSESSESSSSYSSEESSSDDDSGSRSRSRERTKEHNHGRKILMINKKPPIPLPSFIFMPNMETPYFPPLGLPAPPPVPVPMYPMIPVPPMIPMPMPPAPSTEAAHTTEAPHKEAHTTDHPAHKTEHPEHEETASEAPHEEEPEKPEAEEVTEKPEEDATRSRSSRKFRTVKGKIKPNVKASAKESVRDRFMKRVQEKMMARHHNNIKQEQPYPHELFETFVDNYPDLEVNEHPDIMFGETNRHSEDPADHNVNFKYLSELIHKLNNTDFNIHTQPQPIHLLKPQLNPNPPPDLHPNSHPNTYTNPQTNPQINPHMIPLPNPRSNVNSNTRRNIDSKRHPLNNKIISVVRNQPLRKSNNALAVNYSGKDEYADLGRQIAALVRKIEGKGDRPIDINIEGEGMFTNIPTQAILNDNGFSSRSYWERFARSPFKIRLTDDNFAHIDSNEKLQLDQLSLEDQINNAATTPRNLDLHQLENIISLIQLIKSIKSKQMKMEIPKAPTKMSLMTPLKNYTDNNVVTFNLKPNNPDVTKSLSETRVEKKTYNITLEDSRPKTQYKPQLITLQTLIRKPQQKPLEILLNKTYERFLDKPIGTPQERLLEKPLGRLLEKPLEKPLENHIVKPQEKLKDNPQKITHNITNHEKVRPMKFNLTPSNIYHPKGFIEDTKLKYNLHNIMAQRFKFPLSPLLRHAIQPISVRIQNQNLNNLNRQIYQQHFHKNNHKTRFPNKGMYRHYENVIKAPNPPHRNQNKPASYFHHTVNHFDYFD